MRPHLIDKCRKVMSIVILLPWLWLWNEGTDDEIKGMTEVYFALLFVMGSISYFTFKGKAWAVGFMIPIMVAHICLVVYVGYLSPLACDFAPDLQHLAEECLAKINSQMPLIVGAFTFAYCVMILCCLLSIKHKRSNA